MTEVLVNRQKGMTSVKELPYIQDLPPPGGFPPARYARRIPNTGPSGLTAFLVVGFMTSWGLYKVGQGNKERRLVRLEKLAGRQAILPYIMAEDDVRFVKGYKEQLEEEARIMANVPGWKVGESVYHTREFMPPAADYIRMKNW